MIKYLIIDNKQMINLNLTKNIFKHKVEKDNKVIFYICLDSENLFFNLEGYRDAAFDLIISFIDNEYRLCALNTDHNTEQK